MLDLRSGARVKPDGDGVEAIYIVRFTIAFHPPGRDKFDLPPFARGNRFQRVAEVLRAAGLHLDERDDPAAPRDEVDLPPPYPVVTVECWTGQRNR